MRSYILLILILTTFSTNVALMQGATEQVVVDFNISDIEWSPEGTLLAVSGNNGVTFYNTELEAVTSFQAEIGGVNSVSWNPNGNLIAAAGFDGTIGIWQRESGSESFNQVNTLITFAEQQATLAWSPDGDKLATMEISVVPEAAIGRVTIWDTSTWQPIIIFPQQFFYDSQVPDDDTFAWSPDGTVLAVIGMEFDELNHTILSGAKEFGIYDPTTGLKVKSVIVLDEFDVALGERIIKAAWNADNVIAIGASSQLFLYDYNSTTFDRQTGIQSPWGLSWNNDGTQLITITNGVFKIIDISTSTVASLPTAPATYFLDWNPTQLVIASATFFGVIELWNISDLQM